MFVSIMGDSISTYEGYQPTADYAVFYNEVNQARNGLKSVYDTWWAKVNQYLKAYICVNNSYSGSWVSGDSFPGGCSVDRTSLLHTPEHQPDIILVYIGFNDFGNGVPIRHGLFEQDSAEYFYDAYRLMLKRIRMNYPNARILCGTLLKGCMRSNPDFRFPEHFGGVAFAEYNKAIRKAVRKEGAELVDLAAKDTRYETLDGTHPTAKGHATIAQTWIECLEKLG